MRYRVAFFGTPDFAVPSLRALLEGPDEVVGVVCQPDRPAGRGRRLHAPPVKEVAVSAGCPVLQPEKMRDAAFLEALRAWAPDVIVVAAYGRILPRAILELPPRGCLNVHASLLPRYRGAAPVQWAVLEGEERTGVTIMRMNEKMDEGDVLLQGETEIRAGETAGELLERLAVLGARTLMAALDDMQAGRLEERPQDHSQATYARMIRKEDGVVDWSMDAPAIARRVRAFHPWPCAFTWLGDKRLRILRAHPVAAPETVAPGTVLCLEPEIVVATGRGALAIDELQLEGRRVLPADEFRRSPAMKPGDRLGGPPSG